MAATAVAVIAGVPLAAYAAAVVASAAVTTARPAQSTLLPSVSVTPDQLTVANVAVSWVEAAGIAAAGLMSGALIAVAGVASVFAVCAGLGLAAALLVVGLRVPPLAAAVGGRGLFGLDSGTSVPVVQIALLRSLPLFAELQAPALEGLAGALTPAVVPAGTVLIRQGDPGDAYYAIAAGELDARQDGHLLRRCGRGEGVGEIALLRAIPRTATVVAHTAATVYKLDREPFLTAVLGHAPTQRQAERIADTRLAADAAPADSDTAG